MTRNVYIGLGSNLGDTAATLRAAVDALRAHPAIENVQVSTFYATEPLGDASQSAYLNAVAKIETSLSPAALLAAMQAIEDQMGRVRAGRWQPRTIDLDLLLYGDEVIATPELTVPHSQMHLRSFVLRGLCELDGKAVHPTLHQTAGELYRRLNGRDFFLDAARPQWVSVAGLIGVGKTTLAARLAEALSGRMISEKYDDNPYLAQVYAGHTDKALDSELFFLSSSAAQLRRDRMKAGKRYISDYVFDKALIYASSWLGAEDLATYKKHYACVAEEVACPVLVIYLEDSVEHCLDRIRRRNRPYEQRIERTFLETLSQKYEALYADWSDCPVVRLKAEACVRPEQAAVFADQVRQYLTT